MSNELVTRTVGMNIQTIDELARVADMMAKSGYFKDVRDAAQAGVKIMAGQGWGIAAFDAITGIHVIQGKPAIGAGLMAAKVKGSGKYDYRVLELSGIACRIEFFQGTESLGVSEFTLEDAKAAGTQNLQKYARNMLFARAMSNGVKWFVPDVFTQAVYVPEELGAPVDGDGNVIDVPSRAAPERQLEEPLVGEIEPEPADDDQSGMFPPEDGLPEGLQGEPGITPAQLKAVHTRLTKLGFNGKKEDKDLAREFIGHMVGRTLESSKDLTKSEAGTLLELDDSTMADALDAFRAERQMAAEEEAA